MKKIYSNGYFSVKTATIVLWLCLFSIAAVAQTVRGTVRSNNGDKLPGVSVVIKGTTKGTSTDKEGTYSIDVRKGQLLIFSFVGYELQEVAISEQKTVDVSLKEASETLEEVVVTAENRSVSAQRVPITMDLVTGKTIQKQGISDLLQLQAIAPSLNIVQKKII